MKVLQDIKEALENDFPLASSYNRTLLAEASLHAGTINHSVGTMLEILILSLPLKCQSSAHSGSYVRRPDVMPSISPSTTPRPYRRW